MPTIKTIFLYNMFGFGWNGIKLPVNRYYAVAITNQLDEWIINHCRFAGKQNVKWYTLNHNKLVTRGIRQTTNFDIIEQALSRLDISDHFSISKICLAFFYFTLFRPFHVGCRLSSVDCQEGCGPSRFFRVFVCLLCIWFQQQPVNTKIHWQSSLLCASFRLISRRAGEIPYMNGYSLHNAFRL